jgi:hypothetical protein
MAKANENLWAKILSGTLPEGDPAPRPDPTPDPSPEGFLHKLGSLLSIHHGAEPTPQPNAGDQYGPPAPAPSPAPNSASHPWLKKLGDILSLHHDGAATPTPTPNTGPDEVPAHKMIQSPQARAGRAVIPPPQSPSATRDRLMSGAQSASNLAAVSAQDQPTIGNPPIDASALPSPGNLAARLGDQLPYVAPRSGQKREADVSEELHQDQKQARTSWADADQMKQITNSILGLPMIEEQVKQNELHKRLLSLQSLGMPNRLDLSPLAALADSWVQNAKVGNKSNLEGAAIQAAKARSDRKNGLEQSLKDIDSSQNQISNTVLKAAQDFKNGQDTKESYSKLAEAAKASNSDPMGKYNPITAMSTFDHLVERGMNTQKDQEASTEIRHLQDMIQNGNAVTDRNFPLLLAKVVAGSGRIAAYEVAREAGSPEVMRQFDQLWSTLANGRITPENMQDYAHFVNLLAHNHNLMRGIQAKRFGKIGQDYVPQDHVDAALPGSFVYDVPETVHPGGHRSTGKVKPSTEALIQQYFQDRHKANGGK